MSKQDTTSHEEGENAKLNDTIAMTRHKKTRAGCQPHLKSNIPMQLISISISCNDSKGQASHSISWKDGTVLAEYLSVL